MDKNMRICIIGGGPAGTSTAMYLEKAGFDNYVIYPGLEGPLHLFRLRLLRRDSRRLRA